jgi:hypothetical protein
MAGPRSRRGAPAAAPPAAGEPEPAPLASSYVGVAPSRRRPGVASSAPPTWTATAFAGGSRLRVGTGHATAAAAARARDGAVLALRGSEHGGLNFPVADYGVAGKLQGAELAARLAELAGPAPKRGRPARARCGVCVACVQAAAAGKRARPCEKAKASTPAPPRARPPAPNPKKPRPPPSRLESDLRARHAASLPREPPPPGAARLESWAPADHAAWLAAAVEAGVGAVSRPRAKAEPHCGACGRAGHDARACPLRAYEKAGPPPPSAPVDPVEAACDLLLTSLANEGLSRAEAVPPPRAGGRAAAALAALAAEVAAAVAR